MIYKGKGSFDAYFADNVYNFQEHRFLLRYFLSVCLLLLLFLLPERFLYPRGPEKATTPRLSVRICTAISISSSFMASVSHWPYAMENTLSVPPSSLPELLAQMGSKRPSRVTKVFKVSLSIPPSFFASSNELVIVLHESGNNSI